MTKILIVATFLACAFSFFKYSADRIGDRVPTNTEDDSELINRETPDFAAPAKTPDLNLEPAVLVLPTPNSTPEIIPPRVPELEQVKAEDGPPDASFDTREADATLRELQERAAQQQAELQARQQASPPCDPMMENCGNQTIQSQSWQTAPPQFEEPINGTEQYQQNPNGDDSYLRNPTGLPEQPGQRPQTN